jgi:hypothetical protein
VEDVDSDDDESDSESPTTVDKYANYFCDMLRL